MPNSGLCRWLPRDVSSARKLIMRSAQEKQAQEKQMVARMVTTLHLYPPVESHDSASNWLDLQQWGISLFDRRCRTALNRLVCSPLALLARAWVIVRKEA